MTTEVTRKWIEAAKILAEDPLRAVRCPERGDGILSVRDEHFTEDPTLVERYLVCETCGARNILRMKLLPPKK